MKQIGHFIGGKEVAGKSGRNGDVFNPATGEKSAQVSLASKAELDAAIAKAIDLVTPQNASNYFVACGYQADTV